MMIHDKDLLNYVKFDEKAARLFKIEENNYAITYFDVQSVANFYETDIAEAVEKICESHNVSPEDIDITLEYADTVEEIDRIIKSQKESLRLYEKVGNINRANILRVSIEKLKKRRAELLEKEAKEKGRV